MPDRVNGLDSGADDYMLKPFDMEELHARIRSLIRRAGGRVTTDIIYRDIVVSPVSHTVSRNGEAVILTRMEYGLLLQLLENQGRVYTRQHLKESLYGWDCDEFDSNTIEVHVSHIRKKVDHSLIKTIRGVGYTIEERKLMKSIRLRVIVVVLGVILLCWLALIPVTQYQIRTQINSMMDLRGEYLADTLLVILEGEVKEGGTAGLALNPTGSFETHHWDSENPPPFQLWVEGHLRGRTVSMPDFPPPNIDTPKWQVTTVDGREWRVLTKGKEIVSQPEEDSLRGWVVVGIPLEGIEELADGLVFRSMWPLFVTLPILAIAVFIGIGFAIRPLQKIATAGGQSVAGTFKAI